MPCAFCFAELSVVSGGEREGERQEAKGLCIPSLGHVAGECSVSHGVRLSCLRPGRQVYPRALGGPGCGLRVLKADL